MEEGRFSSILRDRATLSKKIEATPYKRQKGLLFYKKMRVSFPTRSEGMNAGKNNIFITLLRSQILYRYCIRIWLFI
jgi:hypothetical protein